MAKILEVRRCELVEVLPLMEELTEPKTDTSCGLATVQDMCQNAQTFAVKHEGKTVAAYAVEPVQFDRGASMVIVAGAGGLEGVDLVASMQGFWEMQARQIGARQIETLTRRRGLVKKLSAMGWQVVGLKMVKKL